MSINISKLTSYRKRKIPKNPFIKRVSHDWKETGPRWIFSKFLAIEELFVAGSENILDI
jgi:hypothetical protein